jgi:asparagine synthase (glutamine-hydrolysing)
LSLSGGYDSRLVACLLKKAGIKKVLCYTFGVKEGNPEWERSRTVAERLGFDWIFIDYSTINDLQFYKKKSFVDYYTYVAQYVSKFGFAQYFACNYLVDELKIQPDTVFLTGDGGDFFAGSHLRPYMKNYRSIATIARDLQYIHCDLVQLKRKERKKIRSIIQKDLIDNSPLFANVENWDLKERQVKYIINSAKLWEFRGIEASSPLYDIELMDFFVSLPFEYKINQKLYKTVISELFEEFNIQFSSPAAPADSVFIQQLKIFIKRIFPVLRKKPDLFQYDYFDLKRFYQPILAELHDENQSRKILSSNGIFSEWYLLRIKKEIGQPLHI